MRRSALCALSLAVGAAFLGRASAWGAAWSDNFDSYSPGPVVGQGDWSSWDATPGIDADVTGEQAFSAPNSLRLRTDSDMVVVYRGFAGGQWTFRTMVYVPSTHTGETWVILMNKYAHGGDKNWSTQISIGNGEVRSNGGSDFGGAGVVAWVTDRWVELKIEIDLDRNTQVIYYDGKFVDKTPWQVSGIAEIQAIDLWSNNGYPAYFDDISFTKREPDWSDDFDSYPEGGVFGKGDWSSWDATPGIDADVTSEQAFSAPNSLRLRTDSDMVVVYKGFAGGLWTFRTMVYVPSTHTGETWVILMNKYAHGGDKNWSTQISIGNGAVRSNGGSDFGGSGSMAWVTDRWVELKIEIDLDSNIQVIYYDGKFLDATPWQVSGIAEIQAIDLWSNGGYPGYFDDISFTKEIVDVRPKRTIGTTAHCPVPQPLEVNVKQAVPPFSAPTDPVTVTEVAKGAFGAAQVVASDGGVVADLYPTGLIDGGHATFVTAWLALGPFRRTGGNSPGEAAIKLDYLSDGIEIFEKTVEPRAGDTVNPAYNDPVNGSAATGLAPTTNPAINPGGVPTWYAFVDENDTFDFNSDAYYGQDIDDVMVYAVSYVTFPEAVASVNLCVGSDDSVQVLLDGVSVHVKNIGRGFGGAGECQDLVNIGPVSAGRHRVMVKVFEGVGGHGFRLGFQDASTGKSLKGLRVCLSPDEPCVWDPIGATITWAGVTRADLAAKGVRYTVDVESGEVRFQGSVDGQYTWPAGDPIQLECLPPPPVEITGCALNAQGGVDLAWTNPAMKVAGIKIKAEGVVIAELDRTATSYTVPAKDLPSVDPVTFCIDNGAETPACCAVSRCPAEGSPEYGDTTCSGVTVTGPEGGGPGTYTATAQATDATGDPIIYRFSADDGAGTVLSAGPQAENTATFELGEGTWTIAVTVDDSELCSDTGAGATCSTSVTIVAGGGQFPGDANQDGKLDISDALFVLGYLFLGQPRALLCGNGELSDPSNLAINDFNGDEKVDLSDPVALLTWLFLGGPEHALGQSCKRFVGCPNVCTP